MLENRLLHLVARVAVRVSSPLRARQVVADLGGLFPPLTLAEATQVAHRLEGAGTCLSRALTIAARLPGSQVVIGSDGPEAGSFWAHAWVERDGTVVSATPPSRVEITRL